jgi:hypothetical protein
MHGFDSPDRLSQYKKLLSRLGQGLLGATKDGEPVYRSGRKTCGVGALFTPAQLRDIQLRGLNDVPIPMLVCSIGDKNLEAVTGFTIQELRNLQAAHDEAAVFSNEYFDADFRSWLELRIQEESSK